MPERRASKALPAGAQAPAFSLPATPDQRVSLEDLRGSPVILAFYPADWSPVCGDQAPVGINPGADGILDARERLGAEANP